MPQAAIRRDFQTRDCTAQQSFSRADSAIKRSSVWDQVLSGDSGGDGARAGPARTLRIGGGGQSVTIGQHTRVYFAFVTTAPINLDSPATVTLHGGAFSELAGFAADPVAFDDTRGRMPARLVLVDAMELAWQRAKYRGNQHQLLSADPGLVGLNTLQHWLWQRLQAPTPQVAA